MIIYWKPERVNTIPIKKLSNKQGSKNLPKGAPSQVRLYPGNNEIPDKVWEFIKPLLRRHIKAGNVVAHVEEVKNGTKTELEIETFKGMKPSAAKKIIKDTNNLETLRLWRKEEERSDIRSAIGKRITEIKKFIYTDPEKADEEEEETDDE